MDEIIIDNELIRNAKELNEEALEEIFDIFRPTIKQMSAKFFFDGADKEDVIQEAMIALFGAIRSFSADKSHNFYPFAKKCIELRLKSAVKTSLRKKHLPLNNSVSIDENPFLSPDIKHSDPEEEYINNESYWAVNEKLNAVLSSYELKVVSLLKYGMNYTEIAKVLGKNPKSVDNAIQRIRKKAEQIL